MRAFGLLALPASAAATTPNWWPALEVCVAFGIPPGTEPSLTAPPLGEWIDITSSVSAVSIRRGRDDELQRFQAGTCTVTLDNQSGDFDPTNTAGAYYPDVVPMAHIRVRATDPGGTVHNLFRGFVESWPPTWGNAWTETVQVTAVDAFAVLALAPYTASRSAEAVSTRITAIIASVGLTSVSIDPSISTADARDYDRDDALGAIQNLEETENGLFYVNAGGGVTFSSRHARSTGTRSTTVQMTLTDATPAAATDINYDSATLDYGLAYVYNDVKTTDSTEPTPNTGAAEDATSIASYLRRKLDRTLQIENAAEAQSAAEYLAGRYKDPRLRITSIVVRTASHRDSVYTATPAWRAVLGAEISDRVSVVGTRPGGQTFSQECFIEGVQHDVDSSGEWSVAYQLSPATSETLWALDVSALGLTTTLAY